MGIAAVGDVVVTAVGLGAIVGGVVTTGDTVGVGVGADALGVGRLQAVSTIDPIPINNLKYLTLNLNLGIFDVFYRSRLARSKYR
jgi:hypothetical protein